MKTRLLVFLILCTMLAGGWSVTRAAPLPTIITFTSSLESVTVADAEAGTQTATLEWHTAGLSADYRLTLLTYRLNAWEPVFDANSVPLEPNGSREVTVKHPLNFGPPTFLLSIVDAQSRVIDQRTLAIPYDVESVDEPPSIDALSADVQSLDANALAQGTARVQMAWTVLNRAPASNLVFEQVFGDELASSVELPRPNLWIPSAGQGPVAPIYREGVRSVTLRLRVVDVVSGNVYAEETVTLAVTGTATVPPPAPTTAPPPPGPAPTTPPVAGGAIVSFTAAPDTVNPGAAITLTWEVQGTGGVTIEQTVPNMTGVITVVSAQSPKGTATVYVPDYAAYSVVYTLWTATRGASLQRVVQVHCPFPFFFGEGDGCPSSPPLQLQAAYEVFEGGTMIWRGDTREIYVHYSDGAYQSGSALYFLESTYSGLPDPANEQPPLDRTVPVSGFGKVWANAPGVRDKLGWALGPEQGYSMQLQGVALARTPPPEFALYLTLPDGHVIGTGFGRWRVVK